MLGLYVIDQSTKSLDKYVTNEKRLASYKSILDQNKILSSISFHDLCDSIALKFHSKPVYRRS